MVVGPELKMGEWANIFLQREVKRKKNLEALRFEKIAKPADDKTDVVPPTRGTVGDVPDTRAAVTIAGCDTTRFFDFLKQND